VSKGRGAASSSLPRGKENLATAKDKPKARYLYYMFLPVRLTSGLRLVVPCGDPDPAFHFVVDPDATFHFDADPDLAF
jgi:hypothetical protein